MDTRKKNIILAAALAVVVLAIYAYSIYRAMASSGSP